MKLFGKASKLGNKESCCGVKIEEVKDENKECCKKNETVITSKEKCC